MAAKKSGLGKGLDSLISDKVGAAAVPEKQKQPDRMLRISLIEPNREQPRKHFDEDALNELAQSIKQYGVLQPLIVKKRDGYYEIIAGERRWRAARLAGLKEVPVIIKEFTDQEILEVGLIENIQREELNPVEEAQAYRRLIEEFGLKQEEVAKRVSRSRAAVANSMRLLRLDKRVQDMVADGTVSPGHARCLIALESGDAQYAAAEIIVKNSLSVRDTESYVKRLLAPEKSRHKEKMDESFLLACKNSSEALEQSLQAKVEIKPKNARCGKIEIEYYSQEELDRLIGLINSING